MEFDKNTLSIYKCLKLVDLIDYYITKNILKLVKKKKYLNFIKKNIFLLQITNKNNKNSLIILLENGNYDVINYLINYDIQILNYKNIDEDNLFKLLLAYDYFYDLISKYIKKSDIDFALKILTDENIYGINFIDNLILLIDIEEDNYNENTKKDLYNKLLEIAKNIYLLDYEKKTLIITKLCKNIKNEQYLLNIFYFFKINNFDIYPDSNMMNCIDYLIFNDFFKALDYLLEKINYIEFCNIENNLVFFIFENQNINENNKLDIILKILSQSNISKLKNNKNQNIFYYLIKHFKINIDILIKFIDIINIHEQDIDGDSIFNIINKLYSQKDFKLFSYHVDKKLINTYHEKFKKINKKINIKQKLIKNNNGTFTTNHIHNILYTITFVLIAIL